MTTNDNRTIIADSEAPVHREDDRSRQASEADGFRAAQAAQVVQAARTVQLVQTAPETVRPAVPGPIPVPVSGEPVLKKELGRSRQPPPLPLPLETRPVIGIARGIVMTLGGCTHEEAFQVLMDVSRHTNIELREIAQRLVDSVDGPPPSGPLRTALHNALERLAPPPPGTGGTAF
ncbi:ANTAR domain-containing protein [Streptomyces enissocaesilis]|uniref:ANTAR domain-containing protein n=1 Tax=Streptomyces enissocaesilis TaxID=332589 RepID=A0ABN3X9Y6_9ACTN